MSNTKTTKALLSNTGLVYLQAAIDKIADPLHPNFIRKLKPATLAVYQTIRNAANTALESEENSGPKAACILTARRIKGDARTYIQFWKDLASNAAFAAHMDCVALTQHIDPECFDEGLDAMGELHPIVDDTPLFDSADARRATPHEDRSDLSNVAATSLEDAYDAITGLQEWISLAVSGLDPKDAQFWGVDGQFPLGQRVLIDIDGTRDYAPITDFDDYREYQNEQWSIKRKSARVDSSIEDLMLAS